MTYKEDWAAVQASLTAQEQRIALLEANTGAPITNQPGIIGFSTPTASLNESATSSFLIMRTSGNTGTAQFQLAFTGTNAGTFTVTVDGVSVSTGATISIPGGINQASVVVTSTGGVTIAGSIAFAVSNAVAGTCVIDAANDALSMAVVPTPTANPGGGTLIADEFTSLAATQSLWASTTREGAVVTSFNNATMDVVNGRLAYTLPIISSTEVNNVRVEKNFGTYVGDAAVNELWGRCIMRFDGDSGMWGSGSKLIQVNWEEYGGVRQHQVQLMVTWHESMARYEYYLELVDFVPVTGSATGAVYQQFWSGILPTYNTDLYFKWHIVNSTPGVADGTVEFWLNDVPMFSLPPVRLNEASDTSEQDSPNRVIFSCYTGGPTTTASTRYLESVTVQTDPLGSWAPEIPVVLPTTIISMDPDAATPYGTGSLRESAINNVSIVYDNTLQSNVMRLQMLSPQNAENSTTAYCGFHAEAVFNNWANLVASQTPASSSEMCVRILAKFGDSSTEPFFKGAVDSAHPEATVGLKLTNIGAGGNGSRFFLAVSQTGISDTRGRLLAAPYTVDGAMQSDVFDFNGAATSNFTNVNPGKWYWIVMHWKRNDALVTDATLDFYMTEYVDGVNDYVEGWTSNDASHWRLSGAMSGGTMQWDHTDYVTPAAPIDVLYRSGSYANADGSYATRNVYLRYWDLSTSFIGSSPA